MRSLRKLSPPAILEEQGSQWTTAYAQSLAEGNSPRSYWQHPDVKQQLVRETSSRCAYCDSSILSVSYGDIEHILPKSIRPDLVVNWSNLTIACSRCNGAKRNYYSESLPLLNPFVDEPLDHLRFVGDLIFTRAASERGTQTLHRLELQRPDLVKARRQRLEVVNRLVEQWEKAEGEIRQTLSEIIAGDVLDGDFLRSVLQLLREANFPLDALVAGDPDPDSSVDSNGTSSGPTPAAGAGVLN